MLTTMQVSSLPHWTLEAIAFTLLAEHEQPAPGPLLLIAEKSCASL